MYVHYPQGSSFVYIMWSNRDSDKIPGKGKAQSAQVGVFASNTPNPISYKQIMQLPAFYADSTIAFVSRAIISSSLVPITRTFTLESGAEMTTSSPDRAFFSSSIFTPR